MARIAGFDHVALTASDPEATMAFYRDVFGAEVHFEAEWRAGSLPIFALQLGSHRLNIHDPERDRDLPPTLLARTPLAGSGDLCFRWEGSVDEAIQLLTDHGVAVIEGPVSRIAADGSSGRSVYFRDPDGNLLELLATG